jgi:endonuclease YncB( thermonuclease family)
MRRERRGVGPVPILMLVVVTLIAVWMGLHGAGAPLGSPAGGTATSSVWAVVSVTDGDTLVVSQGGLEEKVRLLGIDTPEVDQCGYAEATVAMAALVEGAEVTLVVGSTDDRDQYGRLLRYVEVDVAGEPVDAGLRMLESGLAAEIYDSRIGYARHDREDAYIAADEAAPDLCPDMREH